MTAEGANQIVTSGPSCDPGGDCGTGTYTLSIDRTKPSITAATTPGVSGADWHNSDVTVTVTFACGAVTVSLGAGLAVGVYDVGIRSRDVVGNWTVTARTMLVVYDPTGRASPARASTISYRACRPVYFTFDRIACTVVKELGHGRQRPEPARDGGQLRASMRP